MLLMMSDVPAPDGNLLPPPSKLISTGVPAASPAVASIKIEIGPKAFESLSIPAPVAAVPVVVSKEKLIDPAVKQLLAHPDQVRFEYSGGDRGWKGDVPIVRLDTARIQSIGWRCESSSREALRRSMLAMIPDMKAGRM